MPLGELHRKNHRLRIIYFATHLTTDVTVVGLILSTICPGRILSTPSKTPCYSNWIITSAFKDNQTKVFLVE